MRKPLIALLFTLAAAPLHAQDAAPAVAADLAPLHGLAARVMDGIGAPALIVRPGQSPHDYALRPSEAGALARADLVLLTDHALAPGIAKAVDALADPADVVEMSGVEGLTLLPPRGAALFEDAHDHGHGHAHDHDHDHDYGTDHDPHLWLDPENAKLWLGAIAAELTARDPAHGPAYAANAAAGRAEIDAAAAEIDAHLAPVRGKPYVVFHDAYAYFENRFAIPALGAIAVSDAAPPSPARVLTIRRAVVGTGAACIFSEPQFDPDLVTAIVEGTDAAHGTLDPLGTGLTPGPGFYPALLRDIGTALADCLTSPRQG